MTDNLNQLAQDAHREIGKVVLRFGPQASLDALACCLAEIIAANVKADKRAEVTDAVCETLRSRVDVIGKLVDHVFSEAEKNGGVH